MEIIAEKRKWTYIIMIIYVIVGAFLLFAIPIMMLCKSPSGAALLENIIGFVVCICLGLIFFVSSTILLVFKYKTPNDMIIFNNAKKILILNLRKRTENLKLSEISKVNCWTYRFNSILTIYLTNGKRISICGIKNVEKVENRLNKIINPTPIIST